MLTYERLNQCLSYDPETGIFVWKSRNSKRIKIGDAAGRINAYGYIDIGLDNHAYKAHRLAWFYMTGKWPEHQVDHRNGIRNDNSWSNLREATSEQNHFNNKTARGYICDPRDGRFYATIVVKHKPIRLGGYATSGEAHDAYLIAKEKYHGIEWMTSIIREQIRL